jgi:hypothetical protein
MRSTGPHDAHPVPSVKIVLRGLLPGATLTFPKLFPGTVVCHRSSAGGVACNGNNSDELQYRSHGT